jgi:hypothetical protein
MKIISRVDRVRRMAVLRKRVEPFAAVVCASVRRYG